MRIGAIPDCKALRVECWYLTDDSVIASTEIDPRNCSGAAAAYSDTFEAAVKLQNGDIYMRLTRGSSGMAKIYAIG